ncbi:hypothetical protein EVAR_18579_1 [Eumeta japonica]|uniref:Uncharacterized protein n=1 Tax=Eumeta variegata TaxID=151549 RepID=A0A4C1V3G2_EUMVA|nr:hypothetical protein EVAR_18579_1 [Eumeta japonica]
MVIQRCLFRHDTLKLLDKLSWVFTGTARVLRHGEPWTDRAVAFGLGTLLENQIIRECPFSFTSKLNDNDCIPEPPSGQSSRARAPGPEPSALMEGMELVIWGAVDSRRRLPDGSAADSGSFALETLAQPHPFGASSKYNHLGFDEVA